MDTVDPARFLLSFLFVLGLIGILAMVLKRYGNRLASLPMTGITRKMWGVKDESGRLAVIEMRYIDARRKLVLVKRDNTEHLLLLADGRETVIETIKTHES